MRKWLMRMARLKTFPFLVTFILLLTLFFISIKCSLFYLNLPKKQGTYSFLVIWAEKPLPAYLGGEMILYSVTIIFMKAVNFCPAKSLLAFSRPLRRMVISTGCPSFKNSSSLASLTCKSFIAARALIWTCFRSVFLFACRCFFSIFSCS